MTSDYRLSPLLAARLLGVALVVLGLLVFLATGAVVLFSAPVAVLTVTVVVCVAGVFAVGWFLTRRTYVVRLDDEGYHVRFVRGAGVTRARWLEVEDAVTTTVAGDPCVVLRLRDGRSTTIPVGMLAVDPGEFVQRLQERLRGRGASGR